MKKYYALFCNDSKKLEQAEEWIANREHNLPRFNDSLDKIIELFIFICSFFLGILLIFTGQLLLNNYMAWFLKNQIYIFSLTFGLFLLIIIFLIIRTIDKVKEVRRYEKVMSKAYKEAEMLFDAKLLRVKRNKDDTETIYPK